MSRLTIIPDDKSVYIDDKVYLNLDLSFIPDDVHALQWNRNSGWIEFKTGEPNQPIDFLPWWAIEAVKEAESKDNKPFSSV